MFKDKSFYSTFVKRIGLVGFSRGIENLRGIILLPLLVHNLGSLQYGYWTLIIATISLIRPLILLGLDWTIVRFLPSKKKEEKIQGIITVICFIIILSFLLIIMLFILDYLKIFDLINIYLDIYTLFIILLIISIGSINLILLGSFRIFGQIKKYSIINIFETISYVALVSLFICFGFELLGALLALLINNIINLIVKSILVFEYGGITKPKFSLIKPYLKYGMPLMPTIIFSVIISSSDRYIIGVMRGVEETGIYSASYSIGSIVIILSAYLVYVLRPTVFKLYDEKKKFEVKKIISYSWKYLIMLSIPSAFGLSAISKPLLSILTENLYVNEGIIILPIIAFSTMLYGLSRIFIVILNIFKKTNQITKIIGLTAFVNLILNIIIIPYYGVTGAAITTFISYSIEVLLFYFISNKHLNFKIDKIFILKSTISSIFMYAVIFNINANSIIEILISILLGLIIYFVILYLIKGINKSEILFFKKIIFDN